MRCCHTNHLATTFRIWFLKYQLKPKTVNTDFCEIVKPIYLFMFYSTYLTNHLYVLSNLLEIFLSNIETFSYRNNSELEIRLLNK